MSPPFCDSFQFDDLTVEPDVINPDQPPVWRFIADLKAAIGKAPAEYRRMYGFEDATSPNAESVAWTMFEYR